MGTLTSDKITKIPDKWDRCRALYESGAADVMVAKELGITIRKFRQLVTENEAFAAFVEMGNTLAEAYLNQVGLSGLFQEKFNTSLYYAIMKNRYRWSDKVESTTTIEENESLDTLKNKLAVSIRQLAKSNPELMTNVELLTGEKASG